MLLEWKLEIDVRGVVPVRVNNVIGGPLNLVKEASKGTIVYFSDLCGPLGASPLTP